MNPVKTRGYGWKAAEWLLGVFGGVATVVGLFIMFGSETGYVGLGGDLAWQVGEISGTWMYGLLLGGVAGLAALLYLIKAGRERSRLPATPRGDLMWHAGVFTLVNAYVWAQDLAISTGLDYAYLMTIPWGLGLALHAGKYLSDRNRQAVAVPVESVEVAPKELQPH